ncbi:MAG: DUF1684 domain-containing protein [Chloroflexota bacterium]
MNHTEYSEIIELWHQQRIKTLTQPDGFLTLVGLPWLKTGSNSIGSHSSNDAIFPASLPEKIGVIQVSEGSIFLKVEDGVNAMVDNGRISHHPLLTDADPNGPTVVHMGTVNWFVIKRGDALGIRIRDSQSKRRLNFQGVERFAVDPKWQIEGTFAPWESPKTVPIPTILGTLEDMISPGVIHLTIQEQSVTLTALKSRYPNQFFLVIADETTGKESYGGGRFLMSEPVAENGRVFVDFNKAYNPPCAFSPYATCPRPPAENRIPTSIMAGEKTFKDPFHE